MFDPSVRNRYCLSPLEFFMGRHHRSESGTELRRIYGTFDRPFEQKHAGGATVCSGDGVCVVLHLSYRRATPGCWCPFLSNPMGTIAVPLYIAVVFLGPNPPLIGGFH